MFTRSTLLLLCGLLLVAVVQASLSSEIVDQAGGTHGMAGPRALLSSHRATLATIREPRFVENGKRCSSNKVCCSGTCEISRLNGSPGTCVPHRVVVVPIKPGIELHAIEQIPASDALPAIDLLPVIDPLADNVAFKPVPGEAVYYSAQGIDGGR